MEIIGGSAMSFGPIVAAMLWKIDPRGPFVVATICSLTMVLVMAVFLRRRPEPEPAVVEVAT
jgi:hypothetical protein